MPEDKDLIDSIPDCEIPNCGSDGNCSYLGFGPDAVWELTLCAVHFAVALESLGDPFPKPGLSVSMKMPL